MNSLQYSNLRDAVESNDAALRLVSRLTPAGGPSDKVFPPTYANDRKRATKYAVEHRRVDAEDVAVVLLDSVQSQANRHEAVLQEAIDDGLVEFPVATVEFGGRLPDVSRVTALEAPHRIADAIFRDSLLDGTEFRKSKLGLDYEGATPKNATPLLKLCPTALLFGVWNTTGAAGGSGSRFQRAFVSEIVGYGASLGVKTASRIDPLAIAASVPIYTSKDGDAWTVFEKDAKQGKNKKPEPYHSKSGKGKPSAINHSNVTPGIDEEAGGVTIDYAKQTTVISLAALRKLRFPSEDGTLDPVRDGVARTFLASLGLLALALGRFQGNDLRSRCLLVRSPQSDENLQLIRNNGEVASFALPSPEEAVALFGEARRALSDAGLPLLENSELVLTATDKLVELVRLSREKQAAESGDAED